MHYIVVAQSFCNAVETCGKLQRSLYISVAWDELADAQNATMTDTIRNQFFFTDGQPALREGLAKHVATIAACVCMLTAWSYERLCIVRWQRNLTRISKLRPAHHAPVHPVAVDAAS